MTTGNITIGSASGPVYYSKVWSGADFPKGVKRPSPMPDHPYSMTLISYTKLIGVLRQLEYGSWREYQNYYYDGIRQECRSWSGNDELKLLSKMSDKIRGHGFNAGVFAAEGREALGTVTNSAKALTGLVKGIATANISMTLRSLGLILGQREHNMQANWRSKSSAPRKKKWKNISQTSDNPAVQASKFNDPRNDPRVKDAVGRLQLGDIPGAWLAAQYAWLPLLSDIFEAMKFVEQRTQDRKLVYKTRHFIAEEMNDAASPTSYVVAASCSRHVTLKVTLTEQVTMSRSLGLQDPLSIIWERVPFSFIADWFIPIGSYLSNASFFGGTTLSYTRTDFSRATASLLTRRKNTPTEQWVGGDYRGQIVRLSRTMGNSLNVPHPNLKSLDEAFSLPHLRNAAALVGGFVTSMRSIRTFT